MLFAELNAMLVDQFWENKFITILMKMNVHCSKTLVPFENPENSVLAAESCFCMKMYCAIAMKRVVGQHVTK